MKHLKVSLIAGLFVTFSLTFAQAVGPANEHGFDPADLDRSANACGNFDQFANGGWKAAPGSPNSELRSSRDCDGHVFPPSAEAPMYTVVPIVAKVW